MTGESGEAVRVTAVALETLVLDAAVGWRTAGGVVGRFKNSRTPATATEKRPPANDQRARAR